MTPGMKSSEFWTMLATVAVGIANGQMGLGLPMETFVPPIAYIIGRGLTKWGTWDVSGK